MSERQRMSHKQLSDTIKDAHKHIDRYAELLGGENDYGYSDSLRGDFNELIAELRSLRAENSKMRDALLVVKAGIWREKEHNACGINCAAAAVHMVEDALKGAG